MATILVVDDDSFFRETISMVLQREGHDVLTGGDGDEAVELIAKMPMDLVITDINMPGKDGLEVLHFVHQLHPEIKVITMSDYEDYEIPDLETHYGHMSKPFKFGELIKLVNDLVGSK